MNDEVKDLVQQLVEKAEPKYLYNHKDFIPGVTPVYYSGPYWPDKEELYMAINALLYGNWLTTGENVFRFQNVFGARFKTKYAHMVNSGSSANLVLITALKKHLGWKDGDEIIVSPVGFPTTIAPIAQNNLTPVFCDIEMQTLNFSLEEVQAKITPKTRAIFVSPVLGNPPCMNALKYLCDQHKILLIGDNCDSLGTKYDGKWINEYYYAWTTSFYPAHPA